MADYIFIRKSRNILSSFLHIILNLLLAIISIGATIITGSCLIGLILVIASKWRIFAVNHRYWWLNLRSSLVDLIVGTSFVLLTYYTLGTSVESTFRLASPYVFMALYAIWLIVIKPRSSTTFTMVQALTAVILGSTAAVYLDSSINTILHNLTGFISDSGALVLLEFLIGFAATHHVLIQHDKTDYLYPSLICGLFFGEVAWILHSWLIIYPLGAIGTINFSGLCVAQLGLILAVFIFAFFAIYNELIKHKGKIQFANIAMPVLFSIVVAIILLTGFSVPDFNI